MDNEPPEKLNPEPIVIFDKSPEPSRPNIPVGVPAEPVILAVPETWSVRDGAVIPPIPTVPSA